MEAAAAKAAAAGWAVAGWADWADPAGEAWAVKVAVAEAGTAVAEATAVAAATASAGKAAAGAAAAGWIRRLEAEWEGWEAGAMASPPQPGATEEEVA